MECGTLTSLLALRAGTVLGCATIVRDPLSWSAHVGEIRVVVAAETRGSGIGRLLIQSIGFRDYPLVQGCILLIAVTYVGMNLITDLLYGLVDPRIRYE